MTGVNGKIKEQQSKEQQSKEQQSKEQQKKIESNRTERKMYSSRGLFGFIPTRKKPKRERHRYKDENTGVI